MLILIVASGPDKGQMYEFLEGEPVVLGREGQRVKLNDRKASRQHCELTCDGGRWYVKDLKSRHGTYRNHNVIKGRTPVEDGDYLQIGNTVFVAARMPVEQAERAALLGRPEAAAMSLKPSRRGTYLMAGAAVAAAIVIGLNVAQLITAQQRDANVQSQLASLDNATADSNQSVLTKLAAIEKRNQEPLLQEILASINTQRRELVADIRKEIAAQPEATRPLLEKILAQVQTQTRASSSLAQLGNRLEASIDAATINRESLAELRDTLTAMQAPDGALTQAAAGDQRTAALLERILVQLNTQPGGEAIDARFAEMKALIEKQPTRLEALLAEVREGLAEMETASPESAAVVGVDMDRLSAEIASVKAEIPADLGTKLDRVLAFLDSQPSAEQLAATVQAAIDAEPDQVTPLLADLTAKLDAQPTTEQLAAALRDVLAAQPDQVSPVLEQLATQLENQPSFDTLAATVRQSLEAQSAQLDALAKRMNNVPSEEKLLAAIAASGVSDEELTRIESTLAAMPTETHRKLDQLLATIENQPTDSGAAEVALARVLTELKMRDTGPELTELRTAIRDELRAGLSETEFSLQTVTTTPVVIRPGTPAVTESTANATIVAPGNAPPANPTGPRSVLMTQGNGFIGSASSRDDAPLTPVEEAYKLAFETGQPISIGGGSVNPRTGEMTEGRTIDPAAAKAAGIKTWREWYLMDDFAERMRMQKQAMQHIGDKPGNGGVIRLPAQRD